MVYTYFTEKDMGRESLGGTTEEREMRDIGEDMGLMANPSPIFLVRFLLQSREQADETVFILIQRARGPCCQVGIIFLVEPGKSQVQTGPDIFQDKGQHLCLESGVKLCHEAGQDLDAHLEVGEHI